MFMDVKYLLTKQNFIRKYLFVFKIKLIFALKRNSKINKIWAKS